MATIEDLDFEAFTDLSTNEAIERLRQIRLSRRTPVKKPKKTSAKAKKKKLPKVSPEQAKEILKDLIGE